MQEKQLKEAKEEDYMRHTEEMMTMRRRNMKMMTLCSFDKK